MITLDDVTVAFDGAPVLTGVDLHLDEGELALVVGRTGSGKSTLLRLMNGLVPHFTGGTVTGRVQVAGRDTREHRPRDLAQVVGYVDQNPLASFVTEQVEDEIAYAMESLGFARDRMRRQVEETLDLLGLAALRRRSLRSLSGGEQQRVAIAAVLAAGPRILVLDEPTSALDPVAAEEVLATVSRLVHDLSLTVVLAEHRLERVVHLADQVVIVQDGRVRSGAPRELLAGSPVRPPVVELGSTLGLDPLPLSVREARRATTTLREQLPVPPPAPAPVVPLRATVTMTDLELAHGRHPVLRNLGLTLHAGEVVALMGRNGSGKTTLLSTLAGLHQPVAGQVSAIGRVAMVPQDPSLILYAETVRSECAIADRDNQVPAGTTAALWRELHPPAALIDPGRHPRDLSEGQRLSLALAIILAGRPQVVALDEPTRGLDYPTKDLLSTWVRSFAAAGNTVLIATHDVEFVAETCSRMVVLGDGEVVSDRPARQGLSQSLAFAPQVSKVMHPLPLVTVADVRAARDGSRDG